MKYVLKYNPMSQIKDRMQIYMLTKRKKKKEKKNMLYVCLSTKSLEAPLPWLVARSRL